MTLCLFAVRRPEACWLFFQLTKTACVLWL